MWVSICILISCLMYVKVFRLITNLLTESAMFGFQSWTPKGRNIRPTQHCWLCFFHSFCATDLNFGTKSNERMKKSTLKSLIFASYLGPEVVWSVVAIEKILVQNLLIYIYLHCVRRLSWCARTLDTLL